MLIESSHGLQQVDAIAAASPRLRALIFGPGHLLASLGLGQLTIGMHDDSGYDADIWHYALMRLLVAARVNGLLAIDGPFAAFADLEGLERSARRTAALGFDGKWVIHPTQIETVNGCMPPIRRRTRTPKASSRRIGRRPKARAAARCATRAR